MAKDGIKMSPKYGLNPCIPVCLFCGEQKNEIALLGKLKGDREAPHAAVINYEPCDKCQANWNMGVPLLRVSNVPQTEGQPPIKAHGGAMVYPTGQYSVMTPSAVERIFEIEPKVGSPILVEDTAYDNLMEQARAAGAIDEAGNAVTE